MNIRTILLVFAGGAAGSVLRWWTGVALGHRYQGRFPLATFLINVSGAFLIGGLSTLFSIEWYHRHESDLAALIMTGFLGGYTTFSSYQLEAVTLHRAQAYGTASLYWFGSVGRGARRCSTRCLGGPSHGIRHHDEPRLARYSGGWLRCSPPRTSHARSGRAAGRFPDADLHCESHGLFLHWGDIRTDHGDRPWDQIVSGNGNDGWLVDLQFVHLGHASDAGHTGGMVDGRSLPRGQHDPRVYACHIRIETR